MKGELHEPVHVGAQKQGTLMSTFLVPRVLLARASTSVLND